MRYFHDVFHNEICYTDVTLWNLMDMKNHLAALLIDQPGPLRAGLEILLEAVSQIEKVNCANDIPSALAVDLDHLPTLIFIVMSATDNKLSTSLSHIKSKWPQARIVILVDDEKQRQRLQGTDCDLVLIKGYPAANLIAAIERLLSQETGGDVYKE